MSYQKLVTFGSSMTNSLPVYNNDPATMCVGTDMSQSFNHGSNASIYGQNSSPCQVYMSQRCAAKWDGVCDYAANDPNAMYAIRADTMGAGMRDVIGLTQGEVLLRNTAMEKYRIAMTETDTCQLKTEQFNPVNPASPYISYYVGNGCVPQYAVDPRTIDSDPVMNRLLDNPRIAVQLLINIRNTMKRLRTYDQLRGTRLWNFYESPAKQSSFAQSYQGPVSGTYVGPRFVTPQLVNPYSGQRVSPNPVFASIVPLQVSGLGLPGTSDYSGQLG